MRQVREITDDIPGRGSSVCKVTEAENRVSLGNYNCRFVAESENRKRWFGKVQSARLWKKMYFILGIHCQSRG